MPTVTLKEADIEKRVDAVLEKQRAEHDEKARAAVRAQFIEKERLARDAEEQAAQSAARARFLGRAEAAYEQACEQYRLSVAAFRAARLRLWALDTILSHSGGFSDHHLGMALRHSRAAPDERDIHHDLGAAVNSMRQTLGG